MLCSFNFKNRHSFLSNIRSLAFGKPEGGSSGGNSHYCTLENGFRGKPIPKTLPRPSGWIISQAACPCPALVNLQVMSTLIRPPSTPLSSACVCYRCIDGKECRSLHLENANSLRKPWGKGLFKAVLGIRARYWNLDHFTANTLSEWKCLGGSKMQTYN